ncbi:hypothetical protein FOZ63_016638, partial [Perkinsus olseni]
RIISFPCLLVIPEGPRASSSRLDESTKLNASLIVIKAGENRDELPSVIQGSTGLGRYLCGFFSSLPLMSPPGSPMSGVMGSPLLEATYSRFRDGDEIMERSLSGGKRLRGFFEAEARPAKMVRRLGLEEERAARKRKRTDGASRGPVLPPMVRRRLGSPMGKRSATGGYGNESSRKHRRVDIGLMENDGPSRSGDDGKRQGVKSPLMVELERIERLP